MHELKYVSAFGFASLIVFGRLYHLILYYRIIIISVRIMEIRLKRFAMGFNL